MGWLFTPGQSRKSMIAELTRTESSDFMDGDVPCVRERTTLKHCWKGNIKHKGRLWCLDQVAVYRNGKLANAVRWIELYLCEYDAKDEGWGYKPVSDSMGPCEVDCPSSYIWACTAPEGYAADWRDRVLARNIEVTKCVKIYNKAEVGDVLILKPRYTPKAVIVSGVTKRGNKTHISAADFVGNGSLYRIGRNQVCRNLGKLAWNDPAIQAAIAAKEAVEV